MLALTTDQYEALVRHARAAYPNEACALLGGDGQVEHVYLVANEEPSPSFFKMDSREQKAAMDDMDERGWWVVGIFHSHTFTEAYPSKTDVARAEPFPGTDHLILSLADLDAPDLRAFTISDGQVHELEVVIGSEGGGEA